MAEALMPMEWITKRFELSRGSDAHNVRPMEGMRGFAVTLVFLVHYMTLVQPWIAQQAVMLWFASAVHAMGNVGVDLFFVLSGYLIYGSLIARPQGFARFMSKRVKRIYPAFSVVFIVYVALSFAGPAQNKIPSSGAAGSVYLVQNFLLLPGIFPIEPLITVAWSLSYEMFYYLVIPLVIGLFGLRGRSAFWRIRFFTLVVAAMFVYCAVYGGLVRLVMFIAGILLFEVIKSGRVKAPSAAMGMLALVLGLLATLLPIAGALGTAFKMGAVFVAFFVLCQACFGDAASWLSRLFCWKPLRWLGNMSYSYYLLHGLTLKFAFLVLVVILPATGQDVWLFCLMLPLLFAWTLVPCAVLFLTVERPFSLAAVP